MRWVFLSVFVESYNIHCRVAKFFIFYFLNFFILFYANECTHFKLLLNVNIDLTTYLTSHSFYFYMQFMDLPYNL